MLLSVVGVLLAAIYPFMKRVTHLPQVFLGTAFGWSVPMAFAAQTGSGAANCLADVPYHTYCGRLPTTPCMRWSTVRMTWRWG